jgi:hypothetical protein
MDAGGTAHVPAAFKRRWGIMDDGGTRHVPDLFRRRFDGVEAAEVSPLPLLDDATIFFVGNSLLNGHGVSAGSKPTAKLASLLSAAGAEDVTVIDAAHDSYHSGDLITSIVTDVDPFINLNGRNIVFASEVGNSLFFFGNVEQAVEDFKAVCEHWALLGLPVEVVVMAPADRGATSTTPAGDTRAEFRAKLEEARDLLAAQAPSWLGVVSYVDLSTDIGLDDYADDDYYNVDEVHHTDAGSERYAVNAFDIAVALPYPTAMPLTFGGLVNMTQTGGILEAAAGASWNHYGLATRKLLAGSDGYIQARFPNEGVLMGFNTANVSNTYTGIEFYSFATGGVWYVGGNGSPGATAIGFAANDSLRIGRTAGSISAIRKRPGAADQLIHTFAGTNNADLFINAAISEAAASLEIEGPVGYGLVSV